MAKRLTNDQKEELIDSFIQGNSIDNLSKLFKCTKPTIIRNLKKNFGEIKFKEILDNNLINESTKIKVFKENKNKNFSENKNSSSKNRILSDSNNDNISLNQFLEIAPLDYEIDNSLQKDLASVPISDVDLPDIVYMIVDKKIELSTKYLKDYPEWQFLSQDELSRKTIEIYFDLKSAKRFCNKEQKVIKVPNTDVFQLVAPILLKKGISRIVSFDKLIAL